MNYLVFIATIIGWLLVGLGGLANRKENHINSEMVLFFSFIPFIPLLIKIFL